MKLTREEILAADVEMLTCENVCGILGANPATIRLQAGNDPALLGFPVIVTGTRVRIPREAFIAFMGWTKKAAAGGADSSGSKN